MADRNETTSKSVASDASKILRDRTSSETERRVAGSALTQTSRNTAGDGRPYILKGVTVRVIKEEGSGVTEIFVQKMHPVINFSDHPKGDVDIETGTYDLHFVPVQVPKEIAPVEIKEEIENGG